MSAPAAGPQRDSYQVCRAVLLNLRSHVDCQDLPVEAPHPHVSLGGRPYCPHDKRVRSALDRARNDALTRAGTSIATKRSAENR